jgi:hypothetical protein
LKAGIEKIRDFQRQNYVFYGSLKYATTLKAAIFSFLCRKCHLDIEKNSQFSKIEEKILILNKFASTQKQIYNF